MEPGLLFFFFFLAAAVLVLAAKTIRVVPQATAMVVERLGRFYKLADSGLHVFVPFIDKSRGVHWAGLRPGLTSIDLREQFLDMPLQSAITRDNVQIEVDAVAGGTNVVSAFKPQIVPGIIGGLAGGTSICH